MGLFLKNSSIFFDKSRPICYNLNLTETLNTYEEPRVFQGRNPIGGKYGMDKNSLLSKLKNINATLTKEEMDGCIEIFHEDMHGTLAYITELGYFHYIASRCQDVGYAHEVQNIRQNYIYHLRQRRSGNGRKLQVLYVHSAEYYYSIRVYSECIRYLFDIFGSPSASSQVLSVATSILFSVLAQNNLYRECYPYMERLKKDVEINPLPPRSQFIQEMSFLQIYGYAGDMKESEEYYRRLHGMKAPEGVGKCELAYLELAWLSVMSYSGSCELTDETFYNTFLAACNDISEEADFQDSSYAITLLPILHHIQPSVDKQQLLTLYESFEGFVYTPFDRLALYTYLFEEAGLQQEDAPEFYGKYLALLKLYYRTSQDNHRQVIENELQAQAMEAEYRRTALTDRLTMLGNRQAYSELFQELSDPADTIDPSLCVVMMDLDRLKQQNDRFGHDAGDKLICGGADAVRAAFGDRAQLIRYGGDEFVAVLTADEENVKERIRRLDEYCRQWTESDKNRWQAKLCISAGMAFAREVFDEHHDNSSQLRALLDLADSRMYIEKNRRHQQEETEE